jgi:hypothetical protein
MLLERPLSRIVALSALKTKNRCAPLPHGPQRWRSSTTACVIRPKPHSQDPTALNRKGTHHLPSRVLGLLISRIGAPGGACVGPIAYARNHEFVAMLHQSITRPSTTLNPTRDFSSPVWHRVVHVWGPARTHGTPMLAIILIVLHSVMAAKQHLSKFQHNRHNKHQHHVFVMVTLLYNHRNHV